MTKRKQAAPAHHAVSSLRVTGGFLGGAVLEFADGLNCLIGGRGTGKTTALEFLRFGLGLMPDPKAHPQRHRSIDGLVKANLGGGRLSIELQTKTGMRYTAERRAAETVQVVNEAGTAVPVSLDRDQIFGADVFSQNQIEEIAGSPAAQLALLDRFVEGETQAIARELELVQRQLDQMTADLRRLDTEIDDLSARASERPVIEERLKGVARAGGPDAAKINAAHAAKTVRAREAQVPDQFAAAARKAASDTAAAAAAFRATLEAQLDSAVRAGASADLFAALEADVQVFDRTLAGAATSIGKAAAVAEAAIKRHQLAKSWSAMRCRRPTIARRSRSSRRRAGAPPSAWPCRGPSPRRSAPPSRRKPGRPSAQASARSGASCWGRCRSFAIAGSRPASASQSA